MSCPVVSVNRALCVLAVAWVMMPVGRGTPEQTPRPKEPRALQMAYQSQRAGRSVARREESEESAQENRRNARVTNGR
ncbi:hypothetical protein [Hyalangium gracile]|uniref:hypothetical protein n=1 Tax=Hyalangium gracile TaxID=394092 RepID=UPI001CCDA901|nr:hypothetical protein [Hyalangium gracile]